MSDKKIITHVISLGCPKNQADMEHILAILNRHINNLTFTSTLHNANLILINTCSFIEEAVSESIESILEIGENKQKGQKLCVFGCLPLRYKKELIALLPEVDHFSFNNEPESIALDLLNFLGYRFNKEYLSNKNYKRISTQNPFSAFVKISDGCSNRCTYCLIPRIKGRLRCKSPEHIVNEISYLSQKGVKEIILVAQDLTAYNYENLGLIELIKKILKQTDIPWLRLMYLYPQGISDELLSLIKHEKRICNYLDIPIQHASDKILKKMGRRLYAKDLNYLFEKIRNFLPDISLRTTVMVGFPGEEDDDFNALLSFIEKWRFHHLGCFIYSDEEDAPSHKLRAKVSDKVAQRRKETILELQKDISHQINQGLIGKKLDVLIQGICEETELLICGRSQFQAPEIDGTIYINKGIANPGQITKILITEAHPYDLVGEVEMQKDCQS